MRVRITVDAKVSKESVDYSPGMRTSHCAVCEHYESPDACEVVAGRIDPGYWCSRFKRGTFSEATAP